MQKSTLYEKQIFFIKYTFFLNIYNFLSFNLTSYKLDVITHYCD